MEEHVITIAGLYRHGDIKIYLDMDTDTYIYI